MPKRMTAESPRMRKAHLARLRVVMLELQSVRPYLTADLDSDARHEIQATLQRCGETVMAIAKWVAEMDKTKPAGPRKGSVKSPLSMDGGVTGDSDA